jgi:hypothetical protein
LILPEQVLFGSLRLGVEAHDRLNCLCLLPLGNTVIGNQGTNCSDQKDDEIGAKGLAKLNGSVTDEVMNDVMDGKAQVFDMGWMKNSLESVETVEKSWCKCANVQKS